MEALKDVIAIVYYALGIIGATLALLRQRTKKESNEAAVASNTPVRTMGSRGLYWGILIYLLFGAALTGIFRHQAITFKKEVLDLQGRVWMDLPPTNQVEHQTFRSEVVELDGKTFTDCSFYTVTLAHKGLRPFSVRHCQFYGPFALRAPRGSDGLMMLLNEAGLLDTNRMRFEQRSWDEK